MQGKPVSAGVYLYQIRTGEFVQTKKMVLLKQILIKTSSPTFRGVFCLWDDGYLSNLHLENGFAYKSKN